MYVKELRLANFKSFRGEGNVFEFSLESITLSGTTTRGKSTVIEALECMGTVRPFLRARDM